MKILLKKDWAQFIDFDTDKNQIFVGRKEEIRHLKAYCINNNSGSILLSGIRGIGKTSVVYKVIQELKEHYSKKNIELIPILINIPQFDLTKKNIKENIIRNLIRRLYSQLKDENIPEIDELYKKIQGDFYKTEENKEQIINEQSEEEISKIEKVITNNLCEENIQNTITWAFATAGLAGVLYFNDLWLKAICGFLLGASSIITTVTTKNISSIINKFTKKKTAVEYYKKDASISNLEFDLKEFLQNQKNYKFLFVIDELDKLTPTNNPEDSSKTNTDKELNSFAIINIYKNLFTLSNANYIFITSDDDYKKLQKQEKKLDTAPTLFTYKMFITEPTLLDLKEYFLKIIDKITINEKIIHQDKLDDAHRTELDTILTYLIYEAKKDFFDLKEKIHSYLDYTDKYQAYIDSEKLKNEKNYQTMQFKSTLTIFADQVYERLRFNTLEKIYHNQENLHLLFDLITKSTNTEYIGYDPETNNIYSPHDQKDSSEKHLLNLLNLLSRNKIVKKVDNGSNYDFRWTGELPKIINKSPKTPLETEKQFLDNLQDFISTVKDIDNLENNEQFEKQNKIYQGHDGSESIGKSMTNIYQKFQPYYEKLNKDFPEYIQIEQLTAYTTEIKNHQNDLFNRVDEILSKILQKRLKNKNMETTIIKANQPHILPTIPSLKEKLSKQNHNILSTQNNSKQVIFVKDFNIEEITPEGLKAFVEQEKTIYLLNIITKEDQKIRKNISFTVQIPNGADKEGNPKFKNKKMEIKNNFREILIKNSYQPFKEELERIEKWILD